MNRRKTGYAIGTLALLVYAYVAKEAARNIENIFLETIVQFSRHLIHISLVFMWMISVRQRIMQKKVRQYLLAVGALVVFWLYVRTCKWMFFSSDLVIKRYLWYTYYIPMILIPLFGVFILSYLGKEEYYEMQVRQLMQVLKNTFAMSFLGIAFSFLPVLFAVFLNEIKCRWFKNIVQTVTTIPNFISWTLVYAVAFALFSSTGMVNSVLQQTGITDHAIKFLDSSNHVWLSMLLWNLWKSLGWNSIIYLAAISGIDQELYEAAKVDGANRFQLIRSITIPCLLPTYFVMLMLSIANFLSNGMDQYYVFQNAFNKTTIQVLDLYVYNIGMTGKSMSLATAIGIMKSAVSVALLFTVNTISKKVRGESIIYGKANRKEGEKDGTEKGRKK